MARPLALGTLLVAYLLGSLPVGGTLIRWLAGRPARDFSAHNLGLENVLRLLGWRVALAALLADMLKAFVALALAGGNPWAAVGVYAGHLYPLRFLDRGMLPRGRGNGVLLGIVLGLWAFAGLAAWVVYVPLLLFLAVAGLTGYPVLGTLAGLTALPALLVLADGAERALPALLIVWLLALWRYKANLMRVLEGAEPRLGDPPPVRGSRPDVVYAAFMVHPLELADLWQALSYKWLEFPIQRGWLPEAVVRRVLVRMRPQKMGEITGIRLTDGREMRVMLIAGPLLPDQIRGFPALALRRAVQGACLARDMGAEAFGLGAFWSTVGDKGLEVQARVPDIHVTNGGAYTAATVRAAVPGLLAAFEAEGGALGRATAAVVGASGVVAFGVARMVAGEVGELLLIGRDEKRLQRSAETLARKFPRTRIRVGTEVAMCATADLVFTATSDPEPVIYAEHVKPGAWLFDLGRPLDVHEGVRRLPGIHLIPGGVVRPPGCLRNAFDIHFGDGLVPACLAETMIMAATRAYARKSLGPQTRTADIEFYLAEGEKLGFEIITHDTRAATAEAA